MVKLLAGPRLRSRQGYLGRVMVFNLAELTNPRIRSVSRLAVVGVLTAVCDDVYTNVATNHADGLCASRTQMRRRGHHSFPLVPPLSQAPVAAQLFPEPHQPEDTPS